MAKNAAGDLNIIARIPLKHMEDLGSIRHWQNLKLAIEGDWCWIKDFTAAQADAVEWKILPLKSIFYLEGNRLFPLGSLLPAMNLPGGLLWTPITRALPVSLPALNHNFFSIGEKISVRLRAADMEQEPAALLTDMHTLQNYVPTASAIRLEKLLWVLLDGKALVTGTPLLPVQGKTYWKCGEMFLPTGFDFEWPVLAKKIEQQMNPEGIYKVVWKEDGTCLQIPGSSFRTLSISSFRLTQQFIQSIKN